MNAASTREGRKPQRVLALDVFRGLTMAFMVLVGNPGSLDIYPQLDHAPWNGMTVTDVLFPSFLWIAGVSITLSVGARRAKGASRGEIIWQALRRAAVLFAIGVFLYAIGSFDLHTLRILGVLQRISICYFVAVLIFLRTGARGQMACIAALLVGYWLLMLLVPVPGFGAGNLSVEGNLAHYVDRVVLGSHNYAGTGTWDPEGVLSTLSAMATMLFGLLAGRLLQQHVPLNKRCLRMLAAGAALIAAGLIASHWIPLNKKLWSPSFCLLTAGIDFVLLAGLLWLIDIRGFRRGLSLPLAFGQNALAVYMISEVSSAVLWSYPHGAPWHERLFRTTFAGIGSPQLSSLLYALTTLAMIAAIAWEMRRRGWIVKL